MAITQRELAQKLQVSQQTVSRALRGTGYVDETLRERILSAAATDGYNLDAHYHARVMRRAGTGVREDHKVICVLVDRQAHDQRSFHGRIVTGISDAAEKLDLDVIIALQRRSEVPRVVARGQVDGAVYLLNDDAIEAGLPTLPMPWVALAYDVEGVDRVLIDNFGGARQVGRHLCETGHRRFAYIGPQSELSDQRVGGLRAAASEFGVSIPEKYIVTALHAGGSESVKQLLDQILQIAMQNPADAPTAIVAYNDYMAVHALHYLRGRGLRVPEDISIAGFDGALPQELRTQDVTTADVQLETLGAEALRVLVDRLRSPDQPAQRLIIPTRLRVAGSTGAPRPGPFPIEQRPV
jgi:DNA-binding LacI/PurR family transcriptional regulator